MTLQNLLSEKYAEFEGKITRLVFSYSDAIKGEKNSAFGRYEENEKEMLNLLTSSISLAYSKGKEEAEQNAYNSPCKGCKGGHPSFWKTVTLSKEWAEWEKEQRKRFATDTKEGCFDIDECRECGWISSSHWEEFVKFIEKKGKEVSEKAS